MADNISKKRIGNMSCKQKYVFVLLMIAFSVALCVLLMMNIRTKFSLSSYAGRVQLYGKYVDEAEYATEISNNFEAIMSAEKAWEDFASTGACTYTVSYDKKSDCWLVTGRSLNYLNPVYHIYGITGGIKGAIIRSDGEVVALWREM